MISDRHQKRPSGFAKFTKIWAILYFLVTIAFCGVLIYMDLLPIKYLCIGAGVVAALMLLTFPALYSYKFKTSRKVLALLLSVLLMAGYGLGIVYMTGTMDFFSKIGATGVTTEDYYVVVRADSSYEAAEDIKEKKVETYLTNEINYSEAKNQLAEEQNVEYEMVENLSDLGKGLTDGNYDILFISEAHYTAISNEQDGFKDATKIIYTMKIKKQSESIAKSVDVTSQPFNIYVSGLDTEGTIDTAARSDVNMVVTVNPQTHKILITSLPRDSYISLPSKDGVKDKLTHTGLYGIEESVAAVEALMGIDINYYVKVNYSTVMQLVDAIGGITVYSDYTFTTHGMDLYYQFYEGENYLDGSMALAFARERKSFSDGDFQRNKNQQIVLEAVLQKALSSQTILTKYTSILNAVEGCVEINMSQKDMQKLIKMQIDSMPSWDIEKQGIKGEAAMDICYSTGDYYVSVVYPDRESIVAAVDKIVFISEVPGKNEKKDGN